MPLARRASDTLLPVLCRGEACNVIALNWDADAHRVSVRNDSNRHVRVIVHEWLLSFEINLRPGEFRLIEASEIEQPVYAEYVP